MKLIIDIPDELFNIFKKHGIMAFDYFSEYDKDQIAISIAHGTPYNPSGDLISRSELKQMIPAPIEDEYKLVHRIIDNAQAVDLWQMRQEATENALKKAEVLYGRPQGEWIKEPNGKTTDIYRCSICGRSILLCKNADLSKYPFCHCGAEMKGGTE